MKKNLLLEEVEITDAGAEGKAIAHVNGKVCFVSYGVPGDIVDIDVYKKKKSYMEGRILNFHIKSKFRIEPFCKHFGVCGGCKWQQMDYSQQLIFKQKQVENNLIRIGKLDIPTVNDIVGAEETKFYRNKLEYTFSNRRWYLPEEGAIDPTSQDAKGLGFHISGMFDKVLDIETCFLQPILSNDIRLAVKKYAIQHNLTFYNVRDYTGFLRNLIIRNTSLGDWMVIVVFGYDDFEEITKLMEFIHTAFPQITSLQFVINTKQNDDISDQDVVLYYGNIEMTEELEKLHFKIGPKSFFQTNTNQALVLYRIVREFAGLTGNEHVYDLYTGTGTIANFLAPNAKHVVGLEYIEQAVENAKVNSALNNIENTTFIAGDMAKIFTKELISVHGHPDIIVTDPPRAGMHPDVIAQILDVFPDRIVYVSCNAATQARDLALMKDLYKVVKVQPVDMFPHTHHVENVVLLERI